MTIFSIVLLPLAFVGSLLCFTVFLWNLKGLPRLSAKASEGLPPAMPRVSVIIPARDEERDIGPCLASVVNQDYSHMEVLVVDDNSTDRTAEIVQRMEKEHHKVRLIRGRERPPGWAGKTHALHQGVQQATGHYLLFLDADGRLAPFCISQVVKCAVRQGADLLTLAPRIETVNFWEKTVLPVLCHLLFMLPLTRINDPHSNLALASGPFMLFKREAYRGIGGIECVKDSIVEDLALSRAIKQAGYRLYLCFGHELFTARKYRNLAEIWQGFTKNFFVGLDRQIWQAGCLALAIFVLFVLPWIAVPVLLAAQWIYGWNRAIATGLFLATVPCLLTVVSRFMLWRFAKLDTAYALLHPLGALMVIGILANSTFRVMTRKGVAWKGRTYLARGSPS